jgi:hypothetical protein
MAENPPIAAFSSFGQVPVTQALVKREGPTKPDTNKYHDLLNAVHEAAFPQGSPDMQSRLEWDNIEGEVMAVVLTQDLISGTMLLQINDPLFNFATPQECLDKIFLTAFVEKIKDHKYLLPSATVMKENLNKLMISYKGFGRDELVRMLQAFQVSMAETEQRDPLKSALRQGRLGL